MLESINLVARKNTLIKFRLFDSQELIYCDESSTRKRSVVCSPACSSNISKKTQTKGWPTDIHVGNTVENSNAEFVWVLINVFGFASNSSCLMCGLSLRALWLLLPYCWYFFRAMMLKMVYIISIFSCINQAYITFIRCTYVWATVLSACTPPQQKYIPALMIIIEWALIWSTKGLLVLRFMELVFHVLLPSISFFLLIYSEFFLIIGWKQIFSVS